MRPHFERLRPCDPPLPPTAPPSTPAPGCRRVGHAQGRWAVEQHKVGQRPELIEWARGLGKASTSPGWQEGEPQVITRSPPRSSPARRAQSRPVAPTTGGSSGSARWSRLNCLVQRRAAQVGIDQQHRRLAGPEPGRGWPASSSCPPGPGAGTRIVSPGCCRPRAASCAWCAGGDSFRRRGPGWASTSKAGVASPAETADRQRGQ